MHKFSYVVHRYAELFLPWFKDIQLEQLGIKIHKNNCQFPFVPQRRH